MRNKEIRRKKRSEAYSALEAAMPSLLGGLMGAGSKASAPALRAAIELAREAGVPEYQIEDAEAALAKMEGPRARGGE